MEHYDDIDKDTVLFPHTLPPLSYREGAVVVALRNGGLMEVLRSVMSYYDDPEDSPENKSAVE